MKTLAFMLMLAVAPKGPTIAELDEARTKLRPLLDAIATVESGNDNEAVGDKGKALGSFQLWRVYWKDATDHCADLGGTYDDVKGRTYAERCVVAYWLRYAKQAVAEGDHEKLARIHNGGPKGHRKDATVKYWAKVKACARF